MEIGIKKVNRSEVGFVLYLFCFIFAPPIVPKIDFIFIVFVFSVFQLLRRKKSAVKQVFAYSGIKKFCIGMFLAYTYVLFIMVIGLFFQYVGTSNYIKTIYRFGLLIPVTVTCVVYIIVKSNEMNYDIYDILLAFIKAGAIQAVISILMLLIPTLRESLVAIMSSNAGDNITINLWDYQRRFYAFSNTVLDSFGYGTGILAALPLFLAIKRSSKCLFVIPILLVVPFLNSRTGLVVFSIGLICATPLYLLKSSFIRLLKTVLMLVIVVLILVGAYRTISVINPMTTEWVQNGMMNLLSVLHIVNSDYSIGYTESTSHLVSASKWYTPNALGTVFGTGHNVYQANGFVHSDVGYINDLWLGGVIGLFLLYSPLIYILLKSALQYPRMEIKFLTLFLCVAFLVTNIKGYMINYNSGMAITLAISFSILYFSKNEGMVKWET